MMIIVLTIIVAFYLILIPVHMNTLLNEFLLVIK